MSAEIATSLNTLAGTTGYGAVAAANVYAGKAQPYLELVGALNLKAGNDSSTPAKQPREIDGVCNQLNGSSGISAQAALSLLAGLG